MMKRCENFWGACKCVRPPDHKDACLCQHGIEFPLLSAKKPPVIKDDLEEKRRVFGWR